jgi:alpha-D-ribose 1-methylphosphonate 5-triphosphate synthase subunit PhnI
VEIDILELGFAIEIGEITVTEWETVSQFKGSKIEPPPIYPGLRPGVWHDGTQGDLNGVG